MNELSLLGAIVATLGGACIAANYSRHPIDIGAEKYLELVTRLYRLRLRWQVVFDWFHDHKTPLFLFGLFLLAIVRLFWILTGRLHL